MPEKNDELEAQETAENLDDDSETEIQPVDPGKKDELPAWAREQISRANKQAAALRVHAKKTQEKLDAFQKEQELAKKTAEERQAQMLADAQRRADEAERKAQRMHKESLVVARAASQNILYPDAAVKLMPVDELPDDSDLLELEIDSQLAKLAEKYPTLLKPQKQVPEPKVTLGGPAANPAPEAKPPMPKFTDANLMEQLRGQAAEALNKGRPAEAVKTFNKIYNLEYGKGG